MKTLQAVYLQLTYESGFTGNKLIVTSAMTPISSAKRALRIVKIKSK